MGCRALFPIHGDTTEEHEIRHSKLPAGGENDIHTADIDVMKLSLTHSEVLMLGSKVDYRPCPVKQTFNCRLVPDITENQFNFIAELGWAHLSVQAANVMSGVA